jgi:hypothetical protein
MESKDDRKNGTKPTLLVHILAYRRPRLLRRCCESVARTLPPGARVLVWLNGPQAENEAWLAAWGDRRFEVRLAPEQPRAQARSVVLRERPADLIYFLDDDVVVCDGTFERALEAMRRWPSVAVLGGPNLTPPESSLVQRLTTAVLANRFTVPGVFRRYRKSDFGAIGVDERTLILCNLLVRVSAVPEGLEFEGCLRGSEENLWLCRLAAHGARFGYRGDVAVYHERRATLSAFLEQLFYYGFGRAQQSVREPGSLRLAFLAPAALVAGLPFLIVESSLPSTGSTLLVAYATLAVLGFCDARRHERLPWWSLPAFPFVAALGHLCYGLGFWRGIVAEGLRASGLWRERLRGFLPRVLLGRT